MLQSCVNPKRVVDCGQAKDACVTRVFEPQFVAVGVGPVLPPLLLGDEVLDLCNTKS